tara:strand:+ start:54 stop:746 length:693 start_codon:yes stop_codon:yes gene_type:complete
MSIFAAPSFYNQGDQNIYNQDNRFFGERRYRLGDPINKNIAFNSSMQNASGIMGLPQPILPIKQGGGEGGGGITDAPDNSGFDYETDAYGLDDMSPTDKGLTDDEQDALDNMNNPGLTKGMIGTTLGTMFGFVNPFTAIASLAYQSKKQKEAAEQAAKDAAAKADFDRAMADQKGFYGSLNDGKGASVSDKSRSEAGPGFGDVSESGSFAYGGRVPYMMGGLASLADIYD